MMAMVTMMMVDKTTITEVSQDLDGEQMMQWQYHIQSKKLIRGSRKDKDGMNDDINVGQTLRQENEKV